MNRRNLALVLLLLSGLVAACAPIPIEKVAATARPAGHTGEAEHFWKNETAQRLKQGLDPIEVACEGSVGIADCRMMPLSKAWPNTAQYQAHCVPAGALPAVAQCLLEYEFWTKMGRTYYPSYRIKDDWATFDLPRNPTWIEWFTDRLLECDPRMNKGQEAGYACVRDRAKRDLAISFDATKGCYYDKPSLAVFCYWMAGFDAFVNEQIKALEAGA